MGKGILRHSGLTLKLTGFLENKIIIKYSKINLTKLGYSNKHYL